MCNYTVHFVLSLFLATILSLFFCNSKKKKVLAILITPVFFFILFYNYDYGLFIGGIAPIIISYLGAIYSSFLLNFFISQKKSFYTDESSNDYSIARNIRRCVLLFFAFLFQAALVLYIQCIPWAIDTFPLSNIEAVLFTIFAGANEGAEEFVLSSFGNKVCVPAIKIFFVVFASQLAVAIILKNRKLALRFVFWKIKGRILGRSLIEYLGQIHKIITLFMVVYCAILSLILPGIVMSAPFKALFQQPVDSEIYRNHYIDSGSQQIRTIEKTKNLIVILLESMETNFSEYTPEIANLEHQSINFVPGGVSVAGTSWTIAAITAKLCGIPLNMPMSVDEYLGKLPTYLPSAYCLMDLLENKKYNQVFIQGSSGNFTQIRDFVKTHGHIDLHDLEFYKDKGRVPKDYIVFWGIEDRKLYQYAREEIDSLYKLDAPFALFLTTMDTHQPDGYVDEKCNQEFGNVEKKYLKALRCASKQLNDFILWAKKQPWFENTVISVMGDHTQPRLSMKVGIPKSDSLYWTNFIINSGIQKPMKTRQYSSLDMFPTLLEAMGFVLEHRGMGLGRSLFSDSLTMLELYGRNALDSLLRERSIQYDKFLFGEK
jgi:phosphoglycerol transferase